MRLRTISKQLETISGVCSRSAQPARKVLAPSSPTPARCSALPLCCDCLAADVASLPQKRALWWRWLGSVMKKAEHDAAEDAEAGDAILQSLQQLNEALLAEPRPGPAPAALEKAPPVRVSCLGLEEERAAAHRGQHVDQPLASLTRCVVGLQPKAFTGAGAALEVGVAFAPPPRRDRRRSQREE